MEKMQWFKFSISEWKMGKIQKCTPEAKSSFMELCCLYWINETKLSIEDAIIECDEVNYKNLLSKKVIKEVGGFIKIYFLDEQFENALEKSVKARESVEKRWAKRNTIVLGTNNDSNTTVLRPNYDSNTEEKRKEKKRKEDNPSSTKNEFSQDVFKAFDYLVQFFDGTKPETESAKNKWLDCIDKLNRIDGLTFKEICEIVRYIKNDDFWKTNFLSILKLRKKNQEGIEYWNVFKLKMKGQVSNKSDVLGTTADGEVVTDQYVYSVYKQMGKL
jgi:hypothetical protein